MFAFVKQAVDRSMRGGRLLASSFCILLGTVPSSFASDYVRLEGKADLQRFSRDGPRMEFENKPFEAYIGGGNYFFSVDFVVDGKDENAVGTFDGTDYFWVHYLCSAEERDRRAAARSTNWSGVAEVGWGSFPSNAPVPLQVMWLAFFWPSAADVYPPGECRFELKQMQRSYGNRKPAYHEYYTTLNMDSSAEGRAGCKFYAPDLEGGSARETGWLRCALDVSEKATLGTRSFPSQFSFSEYQKKAPATNRDDMFLAAQYNFKVLRHSAAPAAPSLYPPVIKRKLVHVNDYRTGKRRDYVVGSEDYDPGNANFVSRDAPEYAVLGQWQRAKAEKQRNSKAAVRVLVIASGLVVASGLYLAFRLKKSPTRPGPEAA